MSQVFGTVIKQEAEKKTSKAGKPFTIHVAKVKTTSGEELTLEFGFNKPTLHAGSFYEFSCEKKYGKLAVTKFNEASQSDAPAAPEPPSRHVNDRGFVTKAFPVPVDHPDRSIIRQNALGHAVKIIDSFDSHWESTTEMADHAIELAQRFEAYATGDLEAAALEELSKQPEE